MNGSTPLADWVFVRGSMAELTMISDEHSDGLPRLAPPSESRGAGAMQSRIHQRMFGSDEPARTVGHYELVRRVGAGAMGVVYAARDTELQRDVALKLLRRAPLTDAQRQRVLHEARALAKISHPNVVPVYEVGEHGDDIYIAMEYVEGETLQHWQARERSLAALLAMYRQAGAGLAAAHAVGVIHRDFKPGNAIVGRDGRLRVVDFGLAWAGLGEQGPLGAVGTPGYIAPELQRGAPATPASDQYSFCVALARALAPTTSETTGPSTSGTREVPLIVLGPSWLRRVLRRGLADDPELRWPNMSELVARLDRGRIHRQMGAVTLLGLGLGIGAMLTSIDRAPSCAERAADFDAIWTEARQREVVAHIEQLGVPYARAAVAQVQQTMQDHRADWLDAHARVCAATEGGGEHARLSLDLGQACLARELLAVDELLSDIARSTPETLAFLEVQLAELGDPHRCEAFEVLAGRPPLAGIAVELILARELDQARFALAAHDFERACEHAETAIALASGLGHEFALAQSFELHGYALAGGERFFDAEEALMTAARLGVATGDVALAIRARQYSTSLAVEKLGDPTRAKRSLELAEASLEHVDDPRLRAEQLVARASIASQAKDHSRASELLGEAGDLLGRVLGPSHPRVESVELRHANALADLGEAARAIEIYEGLLGRRRARLGPDHPAVAVVEFDLGLVLSEDSPELGRAHVERALEIERRAFGQNSLRVAASLTWLAEFHQQRGELDLAEHAAAQAWAVQLERLPPGHPEQGGALSVLAWIQLEKGAYAEALTSFERLAIPSDPGEAAMLALNIGWLLCRLGRCDEAEPHLLVARASEVMQIRMNARVSLAGVQLCRGNIDTGLAELDALIAEFDTMPTPEVAAALAEAQWLMARTLAERGLDKDRVRGLAQAAMPVYQIIGWPSEAIVELESMVTCGQMTCEG